MDFLGLKLKSLKNRIHFMDIFREIDGKYCMSLKIELFL